MILVTGATGILGRVLVLELLKQGKTVRATKRPSSDLHEVRSSFSYYTSNPDSFFEQIQWIDVDFTHQESLAKALVGVTEVYHCAATVTFDPRDKKEMYQTNIEGTKQLIYAIEGSSVQKFCFVSSIAVLDGLNEKGEMDEESDFNSKLHHSAYAKSKHFSEMEVWRASAEGLNTVIINPGVILGSGNWNQSSGKMLKNFKNKYTFSGGTAYVDVRDVANVAIQLMDKCIFGQRFIVISENKKYQQLSNLVRKKMGKSSPTVISRRVLELVSYLRFPLSWLFPVLKMLNKTNIDAICTAPIYSNEKIKKAIDYHFIPVEESVDFHFTNYQKSSAEKENH